VTRGSGGRGDIKTRRQALSVLGLLWHKAPEPVLGLVWPLVPCGTGHCLSLAACATRHKRPVLCLVSDEAHEAKDRHTSQHGAAVSNASHVISNASCVISNASCVIELRLHVIDCVSRYGVAYLINSLSPPFPSQPLSLHADCEAGRGAPRKKVALLSFFFAKARTRMEEGLAYEHLIGRRRAMQRRLSVCGLQTTKTTHWQVCR